LLGARPHEELPRYVKGFDVGVVPYKLSEYTANVYPTKLNEYLVMGIPVVATDLPEIERFNREHGAIVSIAADPRSFADAIRRARTDAGREERPRRVEVAHSNSWENRIAEMQLLIDEASDRRSQTDQRWDTALRRVYRRTRGRALAAIAGIAALYLLLFHTNLIWWAAAPLQIADAPRKADAIVVFAGGVGESGRAGGGAQERLKHAIDLYREGYATRLVLSSGFVYSFREAEVMRALAIDQGVPASEVVVEQR